MSETLRAIHSSRRIPGVWHSEGSSPLLFGIWFGLRSGNGQPATMKLFNRVPTLCCVDCVVEENRETATLFSKTWRPPSTIIVGFRDFFFVVERIRRPAPFTTIFRGEQWPDNSCRPPKMLHRSSPAPNGSCVGPRSESDTQIYSSDIRSDQRFS